MGRRYDVGVDLFVYNVVGEKMTKDLRLGECSYLQLIFYMVIIESFKRK